ncbi:MAG: hypothetical protein ACI4WH_04825 [Oscillospiraceae bacterium]
MAKTVKDGYIIDNDYYGDIKITKVKDTQEVEPDTKKVSLEKPTDKLIHQNNFRSNRNLEITSTSNEHKKIILTKPNDIYAEPTQDTTKIVSTPIDNIIKSQWVYADLVNLTELFLDIFHGFLYNHRRLLKPSYIVAIILLPFLGIKGIMLDILLFIFMIPMFNYMSQKKPSPFWINLSLLVISIFLTPLYMKVLQVIWILTKIITN